MINNPYSLVKALFDQLPEDANPVLCGFTEDPKKVKGWKPQLMNGSFPSNFNKEMNLFVGNSSVYQLSEKGGYSTQGAAALHFLMVDDIKGELPLEPTYIIESSPDNYQYIYKLIEPVTNKVLATRLCNALADKAGGDTASKGMVRWTRLPFGTNTKAKYIKDNTSPRTKLKQEGWQTYTVDEISEAFNLKLEKPKDPEPQVMLKEEEIEELLSHIDPNTPYSDWNTILTAVHAAGGTFEQVVAWSEKGDTYDPKALTQAKWDSYTADYDNGVTARTLVKYAIDGGFEGDITLADISLFPSKELDTLEVADEPEDTDIDTAVPFPDNLLKAPTAIAQEILDYTISRSTRPQPILALGTMLSVLSAATRNLYQTPTGLRGNLYLVLVGRTSSGKNAPLRAATEILGGAMSNNIVSRIASGAALHRKLVNQGNLIVSTDEIGLWLSSVMHQDASPHSRQIIDIMMECFTSADHIFYGKAYADSKNDLENINNPYLTVIGATTASSLFEAVGEKEIHSGMFNRFIFLQSEDVPDKVFTPKQPISATLSKWVEETASGALDFENFYTPDSPYTVQIEPNALTILQKFNDMAEEKIRSSETNAALWGRADEQAHKIAMLLAVSENKDEPIVTNILAEWAVEFMQYQIKYMSTVIAGEATASIMELHAKDILAVVKSAKSIKFSRGHHQEFLDKGYMTLSVLRRKSKVKGRAFDEALKYLLQTEYLGTKKMENKHSQMTVFWAW